MRAGRLSGPRGPRLRRLLAGSLLAALGAGGASARGATTSIGADFTTYSVTFQWFWLDR